MKTLTIALVVASMTVMTASNGSVARAAPNQECKIVEVIKKVSKGSTARTIIRQCNGRIEVTGCSFHTVIEEVRKRLKNGDSHGTIETQILRDCSG